MDQLTPYNPSAHGQPQVPISYADKETMVIWQYNGTTWTQLTPENPQNMAASGFILYGDLGIGIWKHDGTHGPSLPPITL